MVGGVEMSRHVSGRASEAKSGTVHVTIDGSNITGGNARSVSYREGVILASSLS